MIAKDTLKGNLSLIVLSVLFEGDKYGYEITKGIGILTEGLIQLKEGSLYPALHKMERQGLIEGYWIQQDPGRPGRKYYRLTDSGKDMLDKEKKKWLSFIKTMGRIIYGEEYPGV